MTCLLSLVKFVLWHFHTWTQCIVIALTSHPRLPPSYIHQFPIFPTSSFPMFMSFCFVLRPNGSNGVNLWGYLGNPPPKPGVSTKSSLWWQPLSVSQTSLRLEDDTLYPTFLSSCCCFLPVYCAMSSELQMDSYKGPIGDEHSTAVCSQYFEWSHVLGLTSVSCKEASLIKGTLLYYL